MAKRQVSVSAQRRLQSSPSHRITKPTTSTRKANPPDVRRSARLKATSRPEDSSRRKQQEAGLSSVVEASPDEASNTLRAPALKRKRGQEASHSSLPAQNPLHSKRRRTSTRRTAEKQSEETEKSAGPGVGDPLQNWILNKKWPREFFEPDVQARADLLERDSWLEEMAVLPPIPEVQYVEINGFRYPLPVKKAPISLRRKQSDSSVNDSGDQQKRESKSTPYVDTRYPTLLETKGSFLRDFDYSIPQAMANICHQLLVGDQSVPQHSLFYDRLFSRLCWKVQDRNEAMIIQDITRLLVPSAMNLAIYGATHLDILIEGVDEAWTGSIPVQGSRPQPDYAVAFDRSAFTEEQRNKLGPFIGSIFDTSFFVATYRMYFPFLTCEVKCGAAALDVADRQNAHSMTIAVRSVIELYRAVKREKELDREILAFSISHDYSAVRIYGHYAVISDSGTTFYRHPIKKFDFTSEGGADKWTAYKFTKNVYDVWMPAHLKRICSAVDQLPSGLDFGVSERLGMQSGEAAGSSHDMGTLPSAPSDIDTTPQIGPEANELIPIVPQTATPDTSVSKGGRQGEAKRAKKHT